MATLGVWYWSLGSISVATVNTPKVEAFYWVAITFSQTLGTALGDWMADDTGLGYDGGALLFAAGLAVLAAAYFWTNVSRVFLFWAAFILTRPLGATVGDFLDKPTSDGGLALSRPLASAVIGAFIIACIIILPQRRVSIRANPAPRRNSPSPLLIVLNWRARPDRPAERIRTGQMRRRDFIGLVAAATAIGPRLVRAQSSRTYRLGSINPAVPLAATSSFGQILLGALAQHGYIVGQNLTYDARGAMGDTAKLSQFVTELKAENVDAIVGVGYPSAVAGKASGLPTVMAWGVGDPVATGMIDSLAHPGGNITGISDVATTLSSKRLELLKNMSPTLRRVAMLWNNDDLGMTLRYQASAKVAQQLGVTVQALGVREPNDFDGAFAAMNQEPPDAILMVADSLTVLNRKRVFDYAAERRLPAIYEYSFLVRDGGLMSYGPDLKECLERAAAMVDLIFKGAKPSDLPFEQPTRYPFAINLKTAKAIGLTVPPMVLALADEVIE